jgi:D-alanyl-D-alanine carboxypeptidase/D-alanyl-D-alanine-endopeptidase (penicillin-binding protein 4)
VAAAAAAALMLWVGGAPEAPAAGASGAALHAALEREVAGVASKGGRIGVQVTDLETGEVLYQRAAGDMYILASNTKLLTTSAALGLLGPAHRFETVLYRRGVLAGTVLVGDLVLEGAGDPCMGVRLDGEADGALQRLARSVREAGIREVRGDVVADARVFDGDLQHDGWPGDQLDRWYAAPVAGLNINDGCVDVEVGPGPSPGAPASVRLVPHSDLFEIENRCQTVGPKDKHVIAVGRKPGSHVLVVRGTVRSNASPLVTSIALYDPAMVVGDVLRRCLVAEGIEVRGQVRLAGADDPPALQGTVPVAMHASMLAQAIPVINKRSQNVWAESLLKAMGALRGEGGSFAGGAAAALAHLRALGVPEGEVEMVDGSGLARGNRASPRALVTLLRVMALGQHGNLFVASMPVAGVDGTLRKRLNGVEGAARVRAKTGTIRGVSSLSGYVLPGAAGGRTLVFSILTNGFPGGAGAARRFQDRLVKRMLEGG